MEKNRTHKILTDLPKIPDRLLDYIQALADEPVGKDVTSHKTKSYPNRQLNFYGREITSTQSSRFSIQNEELLEWLKSNIVQTWTECSVSITRASKDRPVHGAHTDHTREYVLLYVMDPGGEDVTVSWYQEHGHSLFRPNDLGMPISDYDTISLVERIQVPKHTWALYNVGIIHGVENMSRNRVALQIGLNQKDYLTLRSKQK